MLFIQLWSIEFFKWQLEIQMSFLQALLKNHFGKRFSFFSPPQGSFISRTSRTFVDGKRCLFFFFCTKSSRTFLSDSGPIFFHTNANFIESNKDAQSGLFLLSTTSDANDHPFKRNNR